MNDVLMVTMLCYNGMHSTITAMVCIIEFSIFCFCDASQMTKKYVKVFLQCHRRHCADMSTVMHILSMYRDSIKCPLCCKPESDI